MVKRRQPTAAEIEEFAEAANKEGQGTTVMPNAKRDYKAIRVPFNEYEYNKLEELARKTGRTKLNALRWAVLKMLEKEH